VPGHDRNGATDAGRVHVYQRADDGTWTSRGRLEAPEIRANDGFGYSVDLSSDGLTVKVNSLLPQDFEGRYQGLTHVFVYRGPGQLWSYAAISPHFAGDRCPTVRMTANGKLLVSACFSTATRTGRLVTSRRVGENSWQKVNDRPFPWFDNPNMALDYDGSWMALIEGDEYDGGLGFYRRDGYAWTLDAHFVPFGGTPGFGGWGYALEFSRHADYLALGDPSSTLGGRGVMEDGEGTSGPPSGSVFLFKHRPEGIPQWYVEKWVMAPNPDENDKFGTSIAFGGSKGWYMAIGAPGEASAATGIDGNQLDDSTPFAGAVNLY
jgi:trimeric autotransporter adhesin